MVRNSQGELQGVAAVIDKDRASSLLACGLQADLFVISTAVEHVSLHYGHPDQIDLPSMLDESYAGDLKVANLLNFGNSPARSVEDYYEYRRQKKREITQGE